MPPKFLAVDREARFPNLMREEYEVTSKESADYNCIAHAAGKNDNWWWPDDPPAYWPDGHDKAETLEAFIKLYAAIGFVHDENQSSELETGIEKIPLYVDPDGGPPHPARQLPTGTWPSNLGEWEDIQPKTLKRLEESS